MHPVRCPEIDTLLCFDGELWLLQRSRVKMQGMPRPVSGGKLAGFILATHPFPVFSRESARVLAAAWKSQGPDFRAEYKAHYPRMLPRWGMAAVVLRREGHRDTLVYCRNLSAIDALQAFWPKATGGTVHRLRERSFEAVYAELVARRKLT